MTVILLGWCVVFGWHWCYSNHLLQLPTDRSRWMYRGRRWWNMLWFFQWIENFRWVIVSVVTSSWWGTKKTIKISTLLRSIIVCFFNYGDDRWCWWYGSCSCFCILSTMYEWWGGVLNTFFVVVDTTTMATSWCGWWQWLQWRWAWVFQKRFQCGTFLVNFFTWFFRNWYA